MAKNDHIVMFPFMAQGHLIPFLALAKLISTRNPTLTLTLVTTPLNLLTLRSSLPPGPTNNIQLHSLPFRSSDHHLPPDSENTDSLPLPSILRLFQASESLRPEFANLLAHLTRTHSTPPLAVIADVFFGWTVEIARSLKIFHVSFTTCGAYGTAAYFSLWLNLPHTLTDSPEFNTPGFPPTFKLHRTQLSSYKRSADGRDPWSQFFQRQISLSLNSDAMICNTVEEVEIEGLRLLREYTGLEVFTVGPLLSLDSGSSHGRVGKKSGIGLDFLTGWLDSHPLGSVVYVSFGSQNTISAAQMMSLANGLEAGGSPFIWVIRPPIGFDLSSDFKEEWLPAGYEERMREKRQGILVRGWAPQLEILSHKSTGVFLSHCGWNSMLESLSRGVPMIGWPLASEQFYNSKMAEEELGVGVELARGNESEVGSGEVEEVVRTVMGEKGKKMRAKAMVFKEMIRDAMRDDGEIKGSSIRSVNEFIQKAMMFRSTDDKSA